MATRRRTRTKQPKDVTALQHDEAYWSALHHWNLTEQVPRVTFVQTTARKFDRRKEVLGLRFRFVTVTPRKFFGFRRETFGPQVVSDHAPGKDAPRLLGPRSPEPRAPILRSTALGSRAKRVFRGRCHIAKLPTLSPTIAR